VDFLWKLLVRQFVTSIELGSTGRTRIFHVHHKPLHAAIGEPGNRNRRCAATIRSARPAKVVDAAQAALDAAIRLLETGTDASCRAVACQP
jgi:hypothetical protein